MILAAALFVLRARLQLQVECRKQNLDAYRECCEDMRQVCPLFF